MASSLAFELDTVWIGSNSKPRCMTWAMQTNVNWTLTMSLILCSLSLSSKGCIKKKKKKNTVLRWEQKICQVIKKPQEQELIYLGLNLSSLNEL